MKHLFSILFLLIILPNGFAQKDSLKVLILKLVPDTNVGGVQGVYLMLSTKHVYDTVFHKRQVPATAYVDIEVMTGKKPVPAVKSTGSYSIKSGFAGFRTSIQAQGISVKYIHIPYYAMNLKEGRYSIDLKLSAWQNDTTTFAESGYRLKITGDSILPVNINVPPKEYFKVLVSGVRVMDTDFDGDQWDYNLLSGSPPDPIWKVMASENERVDYFYVSPIMKNSYSAAWLDDSGELCVSKGDKFWVKVFDNDPVYDDIMAYIQVTLDELLVLSQANKEIEMGRLTYFKLSAEKVVHQ